MKGKFDPSKLTLITPNRRKSEPFDLRYTKAKRFRFSNEAWNSMSLDNHGVSMFKYPGGGIVLSVQPEETSQVLKQREGSTSKGREFTSTELAKLLDLTDGEQTDFELQFLSKADGVAYLMIKPFKNKFYTGHAATVDTVDQNTEDQPSLGEPETEETSVNGAQEDTDEEGQDDGEEAVDESKELDSEAFETADEESVTETDEAEKADPLEFLKQD